MRLCKDCAFHEVVDVGPDSVTHLCKSRMRLYPSVIDGELLTEERSLVHCLDRNIEGKCYDFLKNDGKSKQDFNPIKSLLYFWRSGGYTRAGVENETTE